MKKYVVKIIKIIKEHKLLLTLRHKIYILIFVPIIKKLLYYMKVKNNKIVFNNFIGNGYGENPKYIAEEIIRRKLKFDLVWLINNPDSSIPKEIRQVKYGSFKGFYELSTSKVWISNVRNSDKPIKKKNQVYLQTWHGGIGPKLIEGEDAENLSINYIKKAKKDGQYCDGILSGNRFQSNQFKKNFWLASKAEILEYGLPSNDCYFKCEFKKISIKKVSKFFEIEKESVIILYAPTFRDDNTTDAYKLDYKKILDTFEEMTRKKCYLIIRLHPNALKYTDFICYDEKIINGSNYPDIQELLNASDYLISDYSSVSYEFAMLKKPVFICALDLEYYCSIRKLQPLFWKSPFPMAKTEDELYNIIKKFDKDKYCKELDLFFKNYKSFEIGNASYKVVNWILNKMEI